MLVGVLVVALLLVLVLVLFVLLLVLLVLLLVLFTRIYLAVPCLSVSWRTLVPALVLVSVLACTRTPACIAVVPSLVALSAIMIPTSARVLPLVLPGTGCVRRRSPPHQVQVLVPYQPINHAASCSHYSHVVFPLQRKPDGQPPQHASFPAPSICHPLRRPSRLSGVICCPADPVSAVSTTWYAVPWTGLAFCADGHGPRA